MWQRRECRMHADIKHTYMQDATASILRSLSPGAPLTDGSTVSCAMCTTALSGPSDFTRFDSVLLLTILLRSGNVDPACTRPSQERVVTRPSPHGVTIFPISPIQNRINILSLFSFMLYDRPYQRSIDVK